MAKKARTNKPAKIPVVHPPIVSLDVWMAEQYRKYPSLSKRVAKRLKEMEVEQRPYDAKPAKKRQG